MKVKCISNSARSLPAELIRPDYGLGPDAEYSLEVGKEYVVYGMTVFLGHFWFYVCDENYSHYPVWKPWQLFRIVDNRLSSYWRIAVHHDNSAQLTIPFIAFEEWVVSPAYYDRLTDGDEQAVEVFQKYKQLMDEEAARGTP